MDVQVLPIIDTSTSNGVGFVKKVHKLVANIFPKPNINNNKQNNTDQLRQFKELTPEQITENPFLKQFMHSKDKATKQLFQSLELKRVYVGNYGRKGGATYTGTQEQYFRIFLHLGSPEVYYLDTETVKEKPLALLDGNGFIISGTHYAQSSVVVYQDPIRLDSSVRDKVPKIRPRDYSRITLIYDFEYHLPEDLLVDEVTHEVEELNSILIDGVDNEVNTEVKENNDDKPSNKDEATN